MADACDVSFVEAASASELAGVAGAFRIQVSSYEGDLGPTGNQDFWTLSFKITPPPGSLVGPVSCCFGRPHLHTRAEWSLIAAGARGASVGRGDQYWLTVIAGTDESGRQNADESAPTAAETAPGRL
jgi:hypothetical protein